MSLFKNVARCSSFVGYAHTARNVCGLLESLHTVIFPSNDSMGQVERKKSHRNQIINIDLTKQSSLSQ